MDKNIIFDWFTIFNYSPNFTLGKPRRFAKSYIKKLILWGWRVYILKPNIPYADPTLLRAKVIQSGIRCFEVLYGFYSLERVPFKRGIYIDVAFYYLLGGFWLTLWLRRLRKLRKVGK